ncbi:hypothetical protein [Amycolatopsis sp. CA-126428]|uniref:hypothetical protein n=1 Tax=Amycolatopsis sp. CA-126428 TaxID=2073158 RepID=UPI001304E6C8|nr:hypothetical protein [Amycolatopsis sp. CA-126428]
MSGVLTRPKTSVWSGVTVGSTGAEPGPCRVAVDRAAVDSGLATPAIPSRSPALVEGDSPACFTFRRFDDDGERQSELGAIDHGRAGAELAERLADQIRAWGRARTSAAAFARTSSSTRLSVPSSSPAPHRPPVAGQVEVSRIDHVVRPAQHDPQRRAAPPGRAGQEVEALAAEDRTLARSRGGGPAYQVTMVARGSRP